MMEEASLTGETQHGDYDVVIAGGGLVGASLAAALAPSGKKILVIESHPPDSARQPSYDERTVALTHTARVIFQAMGVWEDIRSMGAEPILDIHISDRGRSGQTHLSCKHVGTRALGYVVPTRVLGSILWDRLKPAGNIDIACPGRVVESEPYRDHCQVKYESGEHLQTVNCRLVVIADGGRSSLLKQHHLEPRTFEYPQSAVLCIVSMDRPHHGRAYERFTDEGPLALLPHCPLNGNHRYAVVWTTRNENLEARLALEDRPFIRLLQSSFGDRAGNFTHPSPRKSYSLKRSTLCRPDLDRTIVIGNAAHTVHPVAGQGFNLGLRDAAELSEIIFNTPAGQVGTPSMIDLYYDSRARDTKMVSGFTHSLVSIFTSKRLFLPTARNLALQAIEHFPPAKRFLLRRTLGMHGRQSGLALGIPLGE
ncbi:MAG: FAD-dependent monooxygenase [Gammaproteobacteria bacterium]|nr:FAD-dependent monooxygenase [Gammaproteobacteria bacterium]